MKNLLALLITFHRKRKMFLERPDVFTKWRDVQFFNRFRLSERSVHLKQIITVYKYYNYGNVRNKSSLATMQFLLILLLFCKIRVFHTKYDGVFKLLCSDYLCWKIGWHFKVIKPQGANTNKFLITVYHNTSLFIININEQPIELQVIIEIGGSSKLQFDLGPVKLGYLLLYLLLGIFDFSL